VKLEGDKQRKEKETRKEKGNSNSMIPDLNPSLFLFFSLISGGIIVTHDSISYLNL